MELVRMIAPIFEAQEKRFLCKLCILSSMGFTEPALLLVIALLLTASISESPGALAPHWNGRTLRRVIVFCCPLFVTQFGVLFLGENLLPLGFWRVEALLSPQEGIVSCGYPLVNTTLMGLYEVGLVVHVFFRGMALVSLTMNKGLKRRVRVVVFLVVGCVPTRAVLLGASVLLSPAGSMFHCVIFLALLMFLCCASGGLWVLVYCPVVDSLAVERLPRQLFELKNWTDLSLSPYFFRTCHVYIFYWSFSGEAVQGMEWMAGTCFTNPRGVLAPADFRFSIYWVVHSDSWWQKRNHRGPCSFLAVISYK